MVSREIQSSNILCMLLALPVLKSPNAISLKAKQPENIAPKSVHMDVSKWERSREVMLDKPEKSELPFPSVT